MLGNRLVKKTGKHGEGVDGRGRGRGIKRVKGADLPVVSHSKQAIKVFRLDDNEGNSQPTSTSP